MGSAQQPDIRSQAIRATVIVMAIFLATLSLMPKDGLWINDNGVKLIQTQGLLLNHFKDASIPWPGEEVDPGYDFEPLTPPFGLMSDGRLYGFYSLPFAVLSALPYAWLGFRGLYLIPLLGAFLLLIAVGGVASLLPGKPVRSAIWLTALATPIWFYSVTFWEHVPAAALTTSSVFFCLRYYLKGESRDLVYCAVLLGAAVYLRDELYLFGLPLLLIATMARRSWWRGSLLFCGTAVVTLAPLWFFNIAQFGSILGIRLTAASPVNVGAGTFLSDRPDVWRLLFLNGHESAWLSLLACAPFTILLLWYPRIAPARFRGALLWLGGTGVLSGLIVASGHLGSDSPVRWLLNANGLFAAAPFLIWAFIRPLDDEDSERPTRAGVAELLRLIIIIYAILLTLITPMKSINGIHWGCRLLLPLYPLMGLLAATNLCHLFRDRSRKWPDGLMPAAVILLSVLLQVYSLGLLQKRKDSNSRLNHYVAGRPEEVIAAVGWFVPQELGATFYDKKIFLATTPPRFNQLLARLRDNGIQRVLVVSSLPMRHPAFHLERRFDDGMNFLTVEIGTLDL